MVSVSESDVGVMDKLVSSVIACVCVCVSCVCACVCAFVHACVLVLQM